MPIKGENIYKRKDHRWEARYIREYRADGSIRYGYCYGKTYREAKQKLAEAQSKKLVPKKQPTPRGHLTLACFCDEWLQLCRSRVKESTLVKYNGFVEKHIKPRLGFYAVSELSTVLVEQFGHQLLCRDGLSAKTVRDILTVLHGVLRYVAYQLPDAVPAIQMVYPHSTKKAIRVLSKEEQQRLVDHLLKDRDPCKFGVLLTLMTGMRIGELCALRWRDISLEDKAVRICATMLRIKDLDPQSPTKTKVIISAPKSSCAIRFIPLTDQAAALCDGYRCADQEAFVLTGSRESFLEPRTLQYRFRKYISDCGLDGVHFHTLRHTFATRCVEVDFEIKTLSEIMGHSSPKITLERYIHASEQLKRDNMSKLTMVGL